MSLYDQIISIYPDLTPSDFGGFFATISLQDDSDGKGPYIKSWNHPVHAQPTQEQLNEAGQNSNNIFGE
jgi:hypothetical protein